MGRPGVADDLSAAAKGDEFAWRRLVEQFSGLVWAVVRGYRLGGDDAEDVVQTTWLRLAEHLDRIRDPERLGAWLATTTGRECLLMLKRTRRELLIGEQDQLDVAFANVASIESGWEAKERDHQLWQVFQTLSERCYRLLRMLFADPPLTYQEISAALGMRIGSIGPIRARCLAELRSKLELGGFPGRSAFS